MRRLTSFLERLNHSDQPPESQSPLLASTAAAVISFALLFWLDSRFVSSLQRWWVELLAYAAIPIMLAFIVLYRSAWHHEMRRATRALLLAFTSCTIFGVAVVIAAVAMVVISFVYFGCFDRFAAFHY
ncbi:MAG TPA: hypothetical protein VL970_00105 [Candidatus Acidoferrales bacterium]|nr:hypothetical protein [Candidatus Acidoferrales bacterium]